MRTIGKIPQSGHTRESEGVSVCESTSQNRVTNASPRHIVCLQFIVFSSGARPCIVQLRYPFPFPSVPSLGLDGLDLLGQLGHGGEQVCYQSMIGDLEDGRIRVLRRMVSVNRGSARWSHRSSWKRLTRTDLVDGDDHLALLHPGQMLDSSRDTNSHVQFGSDDLVHRSVRVESDQYEWIQVYR